MKECPQCHQRFADDLSFCLSDGTRLSDQINPASEPTLVLPAPYVQQPVQIVRQGVSPVFVYLLAGVVVLIIGAGVIIWGLKSVLNTPPTYSSTASPNSNKDLATTNPQQANLQEQQSELEQEKQRLALERKNLEILKNKPVETTTTSTEATQPTARINFHRGNDRETISGVVGSQRSYVLRARNGQSLSANIEAKNSCVVFRNGSTSASFTTVNGDNLLTLMNNCGGQSSFSLTVYIR